jgi:hypothetical protein
VNIVQDRWVGDGADWVLPAARDGGEREGRGEMGESMGEVRGLIDRLAGVPNRLGQAVAGWEEEALRAPWSPGEWSAVEALAHLRAADDIVSPRFAMILVRDRPPLPAFDERRWAEAAGYGRMGFHAALTGFAMRRAELVAMLRRVAPDDWARVGVHEVAGEVSLLALLRGLVEHEEEHCAQVERLARESRREPSAAS